MNQYSLVYLIDNLHVIPDMTTNQNTQAGSMAVNSKTQTGTRATTQNSRRDSKRLSVVATFKITEKDLEASKILARMLARMGIIGSPALSEFWRYVLQIYLDEKLGLKPRAMF